VSFHQINQFLPQATIGKKKLRKKKPTKQTNKKNTKIKKQPKTKQQTNIFLIM
jgi:hypothetical protein